MKGEAVVWDYFTPTKLKSYGNFPALLEEEDLRCPSDHYF
jgi:hypothetical protein